MHTDIEGLANRRRDADGRHRTLQAALDWSHGCASATEQTLFRRLSIFARFRTEDVIAVAGDSSDNGGSRGSGEERNTLDRLDSLVARSLVVVEDCDGSAAYRLLQPVRQYATARLQDAGESEGCADRHATHIARRAIDAGRRYFADQAEVVARLRFAAGDIDLALRRLLVTNHYNVAADLISAVALYWFFNDQPTGRRWVDRVSTAEADLDERRVLALHFSRGLLYQDGIEVDRAVADLETTLEGVPPSRTPAS